MRSTRTSRATRSRSRSSAAARAAASRSRSTAVPRSFPPPPPQTARGRRKAAARVSHSQQIPIAFTAAGMQSGGRARRRKQMRSLSARILVTSFLIAAVLGVTAAPASASTESAAVTEWLELELDAIAKNRVNPPRAARALALVSRRRCSRHRSTGVHFDAGAVAGAASVVLLHLFPGEAARIEALRTAAVAGQGPIAALGLGCSASGSVSDWSPGRRATALPPCGAARSRSGPGLWGRRRRRSRRRSSRWPAPGAPGTSASGSSVPARARRRRYGSAEFLRASSGEVYDVSQGLTAEQKAIAELLGRRRRARSRRRALESDRDRR